MQRAVLKLGISAPDAVEAATLTPARAFGYETIEQKNKVHSVVDCACQGRLWMSDYYYVEI